MKPKAYSYLRFSTPDQLNGDSLRRQTEAATKYAEANNLELDTALTFHDLGVSGFRGKNRAKGQLGAFLDAVDSGLVPEGSFLLVESFDRLSRQDVLTAFDQFREIMKRGITIVTLHDNRVYRPGSLDFSDLIISLAVMQRANEESEAKSKRMAAAWGRKKELAGSGHVLTKMTPGWIRVSKTGDSLELIPERAKIIQRIFQMTIEGHGGMAIVKQLNGEGIPPFGNRQQAGNPSAPNSVGWSTAYIYKVLSSCATYGSYQPMSKGKGAGKPAEDGPEVEGYYPAAISKETFYKAQAVRKSRMIPFGRSGQKMSNLFTKLAVCGRCGKSMYFENKTKRGSKKPSTYLVCRSARRNAGCQRHSWIYRHAQAHIIYNLMELDFAELFPNLFSSNQSKRQAIQSKLQAAQGELETIDRGIDNLMETLMEMGKSKALTEKLSQLEARKSELEDAVSQLGDELELESHQAANIGADHKNTAEALQELIEIEKEGTPKQVYEIRRRLHQLLLKVIDRIEFVPANELAPGKEPKSEPHPNHGLIRIHFQGASDYYRELEIHQNQMESWGYKVVDGKRLQHTRITWTEWPEADFFLTTDEHPESVRKISDLLN